MSGKQIGYLSASSRPSSCHMFWKALRLFCPFLRDSVIKAQTMLYLTEPSSDTRRPWFFVSLCFIGSQLHKGWGKKVVRPWPHQCFVDRQERCTHQGHRSLCVTFRIQVCFHTNMHAAFSSFIETINTFVTPKNANIRSYQSSYQKDTSISTRVMGQNGFKRTGSVVIKIWKLKWKKINQRVFTDAFIFSS